ncbi:MAG: tRNA (N(6)-L-threonylcarbamoyladenosine(37)-C(2))-methylthiotransferase MtaB [Rhodospirillales bacterium]|nr:tRNA (N(6)-L-threonylcarbamoyladenosine(37)-C(2))-methylthiotransferase MtaB [Rhodospirillales bacterium]
MSGAHVVTLGCRLNSVESEIIRREADAAGVDAVIVNTCAVTSEAVRQSRQTIRRLRRSHPDQSIIVTGCAAQLDPEAFARMPEVDRVLGNVEKLEAARLAEGGAAIDVSDIMAARQTAPHLVDGIEGRARAFVQIQQGCDHRCTFCIVPFARGPSRSIAAEVVCEHVRHLAGNGYGEVVLTGVDICSWGADLPGKPRLGALVATVLASVPELRRLRLSTLDPAAIDAALIDLFATEARLMPHLHLSLQAMDDLVLKRMKRRHSRDDVLALVRRVRRVRPDVVFGADLIAGFPTESDAMFANTLAAIADADLTWLHVFPYSPRPGTPAARMPQVASPLRQERAARLRATGLAARHRYLAGRVGTSTEVLVEKPGSGRCPWYAPVGLGFAAEPGTIVPVHVSAADEERLYAEIAS